MALYLHIYYLRVPRLARCAFSLIQSWRVFVKRFRVPALRVFIESFRVCMFKSLLTESFKLCGANLAAHTATWFFQIVHAVLKHE